MTMTVKFINESRARIDTVDGELYVERVGGNWIWSKSGRLVGLAVQRAIEQAQQAARPPPPA